MTQENKHIPWYKNYILILIIIVPVFTVCGGFYTLYLAITSSQSGVIDTYQKKGLSPTKKSLYDNKIKITAEIEPGQLHLFTNPPISEPLLLRLEHATLQDKDREIILKSFEPNVYPLNDLISKELQGQKWYIRVRPVNNPKWQLEGSSDRRKGKNPDIVLLSLP